MLTKLRIKNFKCLQDTEDLEIRPLTLLVGPNSSGKSSLLQMLLMIRQTIESRNIDAVLVANSDWVKLGAYPEFVYKGDPKRNLEIDLGWIGARGKCNLHAVFSYNRKTAQIRLEESEIRLDNSVQKILFDPKKRSYSARVIIPGLVEKEEWHHNVKPIKFYEIAFTPRRLKTKQIQKKGWSTISFKVKPWEISVLGFYIENEFRNFFYLSPLREFLERFYVTSSEPPQDVGKKGERAVDVLLLSHLSKDKKIRQIENEVRNWFKQFDIANDIRLNPVSKGKNRYEVLITDPATAMETNLVDIGFGASQTLPIIIESFYAPLGSVILIEQPEIHLHPKAQSILGDLFIEAASDAKRTFIIETHSEHILARIRRRIAEKKIKKENVVIYYFEPTSEGTRITEVTLNEHGQYKSFPEGFFEEDVEEAFEHLKAIRKSASK